MFLLHQCCWGIWGKGQKLEEIFSREEYESPAITNAAPKTQKRLCAQYFGLPIPVSWEWQLREPRREPLGEDMDVLTRDIIMTAAQESWKIPRLYSSTREARALGVKPLGKDNGTLVRNTLAIDRAMDIDLRRPIRRKRT